MYSANDTIVALATPPGRAGIAVIRLSGSEAVRVASRLFEDAVELEPRQATLVRLAVRPQAAGAGDASWEADVASERSAAGVVPPILRDDAIVTWFRAPASYTGEDVIELSLHGSPLLAARVIAGAMDAGARAARAGEFTLRAFLNGKLDLAQAEAVRDVVDATTPTQARMAFDQLQGTLSERLGAIDRELFELAAKLEASIDFPEEGYHFAEPGEVVTALRSISRRIDDLIQSGRRGRIVREGATVAVVGRPNVGKSTLFNRLLGSDRAIVTEVPGTTRDVLAETVEVGGVPVTIVDTAGARETTDPVEREGVSRAERARGAADLLLVVLDGSTPLVDEDRRLLSETALRRRLIVVNKSELPSAWDDPAAAGEDAGPLVISALTGSGVDALLRAINRKIGADADAEPPAIGNVRHIALLELAHANLQRVIGTLEGEGQMPEELILSELQATRDALEEVTGQRTTEDLLQEIFSRFCIGK